MGAAKRETSRRALFPGASELSRVAAHPVSVSLSVNVAAPTTSPPTLARTSTVGSTCSIDTLKRTRYGTGGCTSQRHSSSDASATPSNDRNHGHHVRYWDTSLIRRHTSARG